MFDLISILSISHDWLLTANLLLSCLLLLWVLRYRTLYRVFRKEAEQHLCSLDELSDGFYRSELGGKITYVNPAFVNMLGFEKKEDLLEQINNHPHGWYDADGQREIFRRKLLENGSIHDFISKARSPNTGEAMWVSENAHIVSHGNGSKPSHYEGSVQNITDAVQRQKLEDRIEKLSSNLPGGLFQLQRDCHGQFSVPYVSRGFLQLMGVKKENLANPDKYLKQILPDHRGRYVQSLAQSFDRGTGWNVEFKLKKVS